MVIVLSASRKPCVHSFVLVLDSSGYFNVLIVLVNVLGVKGAVEKWRAVKVIVKEENEEEIEVDEQASDDSDGEEVIQSR